MDKTIDSALGENNKEVCLDQEGSQYVKFIQLLAENHAYYINLDNNQLSSLSILRIREALYTLTIIQLDNQTIGNKGCKYLSRIFMPQIKKISLDNNEISSVGVLHLAKAEWKNLKKINILDNRIGFDGVKRLCSAKWNKMLNIINMRSNQLFVGQVYRLIFCEVEEYLTVYAWNNKIEQIFQDNCMSILWSKRIQLKMQWFY